MQVFVWLVCTTFARYYQIKNCLVSCIVHVVLVPFIVGAGSAGSVVASRLSEDEDVTVAVLEAGPEETSVQAIDVPLAAASFWGGPHLWKYETIPQKKSCQAMVDKVSY